MPITTKMHGVLDYLVAAIIIVVSAYVLFSGGTDVVSAPGELNDISQGRTAAWVMLVAGVLILGLSAFTRYELSLVPAIPMVVHIAVDILLGVVLIASPWLLGFADVIWWPHVLVGAVAIGTALMTQRQSTRSDPALETRSHERTAPTEPR